MRALDPSLAFAGFGAERMRAAGFDVWADTREWAAIGIVDALAKIPRVAAALFPSLARLHREPPDLIVLVDFGALNLRFGAFVRRAGLHVPILYYFPPAAWLDDPKRARKVAKLAVPLTAFAHQAAFYRSLGLPVTYFGHPIAARIAARAPRRAPPPTGGHLALLPGSRPGELARHVPILLETLRLMRATGRPHLTASFAAADADGERLLRVAAAESGLGITVVRGAREVLAHSDAAAVASGTAVLEAALIGVPTAAFYVASPAQERIARRILRRELVGGGVVTLPNLVLGRRIVPELLGRAAVTPPALARAVRPLLIDPGAQLAELAPLRGALGAPDALERAARFAYDLIGR